MMKVITPLFLVLAAVLLVAACQSGNSDDPSQAAGLCGKEYVHYLATDVARRDFPETPGPTFSPSDEACKTLVYSQLTTPSPTQPTLVLLEDEGLYTLEDLGYQDIVLHAWEPTLLRTLSGSAPARYARLRAEYLLPDGAAQGPETWYILHLHFEIEFANGVDGGEATILAQQNGYSTATMSSFRPQRQGDKLVVDSSGVDRAVQNGNKLEAWFTNYLPSAGVRPGGNTLSFAVRDQDGAVVQTLRVFADSAIEVTTLSPEQAQATAFPPPDYSNVTPPCDASDPACLIEHFDGHEPEKICEVFGVHVSECGELMNAVLQAIRPTPLPVLPTYEEVLFRDETIRTLVGAGVRDQDYWLQIDPFRDPGHGDENGEVASATFVFAEPISWSGVFPQASQPCSPYWSEGYIEPGHFCLNIPLQFSERRATLDQVRIVYVAVYAGRELLANIRGWNSSSDIIEGMIEQFSEHEYE